MKKVFLILVVAFVSVGRPLSAGCLGVVDPGASTEIVAIEGVLAHAPFPCEDGEDCPTCSALVLEASDKTYYLTNLTTEWETYLDNLPSSEQVTVYGIAFTKGSYDYISVKNIIVGKIASKWYGVEKYVNSYVGAKPQYKGVTYHMKGDTTINDTTYHALWRDKGEYFAGLRQSSDGQQVFIRPNQEHYSSTGEAKDWLLYKFDVKVNDTIFAFDHSYAGIDPNTGQEDVQYRWIVKDVRMVDGRKHVIVNGGQTQHDVEWIEGIGTRYIFFENNVIDALMGKSSTWALCAMDNEDNTLYSFDTEGIGIRNVCPDWEVIDSAIDNIISRPASASKFLHNGHILICRDGKMYTVIGQEVK